MDKSIKKYVYGAMAIVLLLFFLFSISSIFENVDANEIVVIQAPWSGKLTVVSTPGVCWQGFGKVTPYKKSYQYWFSKKKDEGNKEDQSIKVRFNDGGHAQLSGSVRVDMPLDEKSVIALHTRYGSQEAIEHALIGLPDLQYIL